MPQTPYPAGIYVCSCTLTQQSGYSFCPSASSSAGASGEPDTAPGFEAEGVESDHTFSGRCADERALVGSARACAGVRPIGDDIDDEGDGVEGS